MSTTADEINEAGIERELEQRRRASVLGTGQSHGRAQEIRVRPPNPRDVTAQRLQPWASDDVVETEFFTWLDTEVKKARGLARLRISDHAAVSYHMGFEDAFEMLKAQIKLWAGQG